MLSPWTRQCLSRFLRYQKPCKIAEAVSFRQLATDSSTSSITQHPRISHHHHQHRSHNAIRYAPLIIPAGLFSFLAPRSSDDDAEDTPEGKLIMCLKRSILCVQRQQYDKAEQMLHLALRMAQDQQSKQGITYVFDVMANLAMEMGQYAKAERLFVAVMQRLLQDGYKEDDIKVREMHNARYDHREFTLYGIVRILFIFQMLHMSSKIAQMESLQGNLATAEIGFKWVLDKLQQQLQLLRSAIDDAELRASLQELHGLTQDCYAQLLIKLQRFTEAKKHLSEALALYAEIHGREQPEVVAMLNNLAVVCTHVCCSSSM